MIGPTEAKESFKYLNSPLMIMNGVGQLVSRERVWAGVNAAGLVCL